MMKPESDTAWWQHDSADYLNTTAGTALPYAEERGRLSFYALFAFTGILLLAPQAYFPVLAPFRIAFLAAMAATLAHVGSQLSNGRPIIRFSPGIWLVFWLMFWALFTLPLSVWPGGSVNLILSHYSKTLIVFVLLANVINTLPRLRTICTGLVLMAAFLAFITIRNYLAGTYIEQGERVLGTQGALTGNPNDMALMLNLLLPICVGLMLSAHRRRARFLFGSLILLLAAAIVLTFSRAGFLALGVIFVSYMIMLKSGPQRKLIPLALVLALLAIPLIPSTYMERLSTITDIEEDESGSAQQRLNDMKLATGLFIRNPVIGTGIGVSVVAMDDARGSYGTEIHNVYLQYAVELGIPGLILFLLLLRVCFKSTASVMRENQPGPDRDNSLFFISQGIRVSLIAFTVEAFFHPVAYHFYFYYIAGLAIALISVHEHEAAHRATSATTAQAD
jgi:O-antigen ligase